MYVVDKMSQIHEGIFRLLPTYINAIDDSSLFVKYYEDFRYFQFEFAQLGKRLMELIRTIENIIGETPSFKRYFYLLWSRLNNIYWGIICVNLHQSLLQIN